MNRITTTGKLIAVIFTLLTMWSCNSPAKSEENNASTVSINNNKAEMSRSVDTAKRNELVRKFDLINFHKNNEPVLLTIDEFFNGNQDEASIAPNFEKKPAISEYYSILKKLSGDPKTIAAFAEIKDVMFYDGKLKDNEWFYTDIFYFVGDLTKEEIKAATASLMPDEVNYNTEDRTGLADKYKGKNIVYVWWD